MSDIITLANQIAAEKENIRQAIENRGVTLPASAPFSEYAGKIAEIDAQVSTGDFFWNDTPYDTTATSFTVPGNYDEIDEDTFAGNTNLTTINFNNVRKVGDGACHGCSSLSNIVANNVFEYGDDVFGSCNITSFNDTSSQIIGNNLLVNNPVTSITLNAKRIGKNISPNNSVLTEVNLPNAVELGSGSFHNCERLDTISVPNLEYIGSYAFSYMNSWNFSIDPTTALVDIVLPKAKVIGTEAFSHSASIRSLTAPLVEKIEASAFASSASSNGRITELNLPRCNYIGDLAFSSPYIGVLTSLTIGDDCEIHGGAFSKCPYIIVGKIGSIKFDTSTSLFSLAEESNHSHSADFSGLSSVSSYYSNNCYAFQFNTSTNSTIQFGGVIDLKNLVELISSGGSNTSLYIFQYANYTHGRISKVWISKELTLGGNYPKNIYLLSDLDSQTHVYTDATSKPDNWTQGGNTRICGSATWHFNCTHNDFEDGIYNS